MARLSGSGLEAVARSSICAARLPLARPALDDQEPGRDPQPVQGRRDTTGNMPPLPGIFPDMLAPVVRTSRDGERVLEMMRWGFPPPPSAGPQPVTNVRNTASGYWRGWLEPRFRCLVPATSFCEWTDSRPKVTHWFAIDESRPLFAFAGIWRPWTGARGPKSAPIEGEHCCSRS